MAKLKIDNISANYGPFAILHKTSLKVDSGEVVALMGPNGAGKTTLLRTIAGIVPPIVLNGSVTINEEKLMSLKRHERAEKGIVLIPDGREIFSGLTVSENLIVASYAPHAKKFRDESYEIVYDLFPILEQRYDQMAETLSGGQRQMLCIAMGLMNRPQFFLLDEPSTGLAPIIVLDLFNKIKEICEKYNIGVLLVEQQARLALKLATRGYLLSSGEIVLEGSREDLISNEELSKYYLIGVSK